jgi:hypothetical protein
MVVVVCNIVAEAEVGGDKRDGNERRSDILLHLCGHAGRLGLPAAAVPLVRQMHARL